MQILDTYFLLEKETALKLSFFLGGGINAESVYHCDF